MKNKVYVVHCVDTEGPLYEEKNVPFEMVKNIFGIDIEPSDDNLIKLQTGLIDLNGKESEIKKLLDPHRITTRGTWQEIDKVLSKVTSNEYRNKLVDSNGNGWLFNWFCMAHEGFSGDNPRKRVNGYTTVYDHYRKIIDGQNSKDFIGFHYHPLSLSGNYNDSGTAYWGTNNLPLILCHLIMDRCFFPAAFRPGFHTERPDSHWFLEQWIPFDYGNQSMKDLKEGQEDLADGRFGDWRFSPTEWIPYHPSYSNYQRKGDCNRWITRCLNMYARTRQLEIEDVEDAFNEAKEFGSSILAFTNHDYKDMEYEIDRVQEMINAVRINYKDVEIEFQNPVEAMRKCLNLEYQEFELKVEIYKKNGRSFLSVKTDNSIFGAQPFLAIKDIDGKYYWDNLDFYKPDREWTYTFDNNTIDISKIDKIGIASNNKCGYTVVALIDIVNDTVDSYYYNKR